MNDIEITKELTGHTHRIGSLEHRMDDAEKVIENIHNISKGLEILIVRTENTDKNIQKLTEDIEGIKDKPNMRMTQITTAIITAIATGFIGGIIAVIINFF